jgi:eukaryotic-like serine/threonine-protein kinase
MEAGHRVVGAARLKDRYRIHEPIAQGGMGAVYRAVDEQSGEEVAIKHLLHLRHSARFEIEARLLFELDHPRVVRVQDYFGDEGGQYLVMDLIRGADLDLLLEERGTPGLPITEAVEYTRQACEALQYIHDQRIIHRDVKPPNLICCDGEIVIVDFGIARALGSGSTLTQALGTPGYIAPEVAMTGRASARSDVYGLAATLWTLIAGMPPSEALGSPLSKLVPDVPRELEATLQAAMEQAPERRTASAEAFAHALGANLDSQGSSLTLSIDLPRAPKRLLEAVVEAAACVFDAAAASIALRDERTGELVYSAAWGTAAQNIVGVRLAQGAGLAGAVVESGDGIAIPDCRNDPRWESWISQTVGYTPYTMLIVPLKRGDEAVGALTILDRRDGQPYEAEQVEPLSAFADVALAAIGSAS